MNLKLKNHKLKTILVIIASSFSLMSCNSGTNGGANNNLITGSNEKSTDYSGVKDYNLMIGDGITFNGKEIIPHNNGFQVELMTNLGPQSNPIPAYTSDSFVSGREVYTYVNQRTSVSENKFEISGTQGVHITSVFSGNAGGGYASLSKEASIENALVSHIEQFTTSAFYLNNIVNIINSANNAKTFDDLKRNLNREALRSAILNASPQLFLEAIRKINDAKNFQERKEAIDSFYQTFGEYMVYKIYRGRFAIADMVVSQKDTSQSSSNAWEAAIKIKTPWTKTDLSSKGSSGSSIITKNAQFTKYVITNPTDTTAMSTLNYEIANNFELLKNLQSVDITQLTVPEVKLKDINLPDPDPVRSAQSTQNKNTTIKEIRDVNNEVKSKASIGDSASYKAAQALVKENMTKLNSFDSIDDTGFFYVTNESEKNEIAQIKREWVIINAYDTAEKAMIEKEKAEKEKAEIEKRLETDQKIKNTENYNKWLENIKYSKNIYYEGDSVVGKTMKTEDFAQKYPTFQGWLDDLSLVVWRELRQGEYQKYLETSGKVTKEYLLTREKRIAKILENNNKQQAKSSTNVLKSNATVKGDSIIYDFDIIHWSIIFSELGNLNSAGLPFSQKEYNSKLITALNKSKEIRFLNYAHMVVSVTDEAAINSTNTIYPIYETKKKYAYDKYGQIYTNLGTLMGDLSRNATSVVFLDKVYSLADGSPGQMDGIRLYKDIVTAIKSGSLYSGNFGEIYRAMDAAGLMSEYGNLFAFVEQKPETRGTYIQNTWLYKDNGDNNSSVWHYWAWGQAWKRLPATKVSFGGTSVDQAMLSKLDLPDRSVIKEGGLEKLKNAYWTESIAVTAVPIINDYTVMNYVGSNTTSFGSGCYNSFTPDGFAGTNALYHNCITNSSYVTNLSFLYSNGYITGWPGNPGYTLSLSAYNPLASAIWAGSFNNVPGDPKFTYYTGVANDYSYVVRDPKNAKFKERSMAYSIEPHLAFDSAPNGEAYYKGTYNMYRLVGQNNYPYLDKLKFMGGVVNKSLYISNGSVSDTFAYGQTRIPNDNSIYNYYISGHGCPTANGIFGNGRDGIDENWCVRWNNINWVNLSDTQFKTVVRITDADWERIFSYQNIRDRKLNFVKFY